MKEKKQKRREKRKVESERTKGQKEENDENEGEPDGADLLHDRDRSRHDDRRQHLPQGVRLPEGLPHPPADHHHADCGLVRTAVFPIKSVFKDLGSNPSLFLRRSY